MGFWFLVFGLGLLFLEIGGRVRDGGDEQVNVGIDERRVCFILTL